MNILSGLGFRVGGLDFGVVQRCRQERLLKLLGLSRG